MGAGRPAPHPAGRRRCRWSWARRAARCLAGAAVIWWRAVAALVVALAVQVGTNYANDYSDGIRGTDADRVGPVRLVASGLAAPARGAAGRLVSLRRGGVAGLALAAAPAGGWCRRGGLLRRRLALHRRAPALRLPRPRRGVRLRLLRAGGHGGVGLRPAPPAAGRALPLVGLDGCRVAVLLWPPPCWRPTTCGTSPGTPRRASARWPCGWAGAGPAGCTWAALVGAGVGRGGWWPCAALGPAGPAGRCPLAVAPCRVVLGGAEGRELLPVLGATGRLQLVVGVLLDRRHPAVSASGRRRPGRSDRRQRASQRRPGGRSAGCSRWAAWPAPGTTREDGDRERPRPWPRADRDEPQVGWRRPRPGPGRARVPSRSHSGSWVPVPASRRLEARPAGVLPRRVGSRRAGRAGRRTSGAASHRRGTPSTSSAASSSSASASSRSRRCGPGRRRPRCPAVPPTSTRRRTPVGLAERRVQGHPGAQGVAEQVDRRAVDTSDGHLGSRSPRARQVDPHAAEPPWPGRSTRTSAVRGGQQARPNRPQSRAGLGEAVEPAPAARRPAGPCRERSARCRRAARSVSVASRTRGERPGHLRRHPGRRVGPRRCHRRRGVPGLALDAAGPGAGRPARARGPRAAGRARRGLLRARPGAGDRAARRWCCTTSGTAAAELHPAVVEAHHAGVPLVVCTADRPPELHHVGAPQTIDQARLFGGRCAGPAPPGCPTGRGGRTWRSLAARGVAEAAAGPLGPGPVHLNLAFREPLVAEPGPLPAGRPGGRPWHEVRRPAAPGRRRGRSDPARPAWPGPGHGGGRRRLRPAASGVRPWPTGSAGRCWPTPARGAGCARPSVVAAADALARAPELRRRAPARGGGGAGRAVGVARCWPRFVAEAAGGRGRGGGGRPAGGGGSDPDRVVDRGRPARTAPAWLAAALAGCPGRRAARPGGCDRWRAAEAAAQRAVDEVLAERRRRARRGAHRARAGPALAAGPRRRRHRGGRLLDAGARPGVVRAAAGPAAGGAGQPGRQRDRRGGLHRPRGGRRRAGPVVGLLGDLAFLHDASALVRPAGPAPAARCTLVVVDNGGGGIFGVPAPGRGGRPRTRFEQLFGTPQADRGGARWPAASAWRRPTWARRASWRRRCRRPVGRRRPLGGAGDGCPTGAGQRGAAPAAIHEAAAAGGPLGDRRLAVGGGRDPAPVEPERHPRRQVHHGLRLGAEATRRRAPPRRWRRGRGRRPRSAPSPRRRPARRGSRTKTGSPGDLPGPAIPADGLVAAAGRSGRGGRRVGAVRPGLPRRSSRTGTGRPASVSSTRGNSTDRSSSGVRRHRARRPGPPATARGVGSTEPMASPGARVERPVVAADVEDHGRRRRRRRSSRGRRSRGQVGHPADARALGAAVEHAQPGAGLRAPSGTGARRRPSPCRGRRPPAGP